MSSQPHLVASVLIPGYVISFGNRMIAHVIKIQSLWYRVGPSLIWHLSLNRGGNVETWAWTQRRHGHVSIYVTSQHQGYFFLLWPGSPKNNLLLVKTFSAIFRVWPLFFYKWSSMKHMYFLPFHNGRNQNYTSTVFLKSPLSALSQPVWAAELKSIHPTSADQTCAEDTQLKGSKLFTWAKLYGELNLRAAPSHINNQYQQI